MSSIDVEKADSSTQFFFGVSTPDTPPQSHASPVPKPTNPKDWPTWRKVYVSFILFFITLLATYTSGVYSPGIESMRKDISTSKEVAQLGTSLFMFGMALGSLVWGPLSQSLGRRPVFLMSLLGSTLFNLGVCLGKTMVSLLVCRTFAGVAASATFANAAGSIVDMTTERSRIPYNTLFRYVTFLGPPLSALLGAVAVNDSDWRWNLRAIPIIFFAALVLYAITVPETFMPVLEHKASIQANRHHDGVMGEAGNWAAKLLPQKETIQLVAGNVRKSFLVPWILLFEEPVVMVICFYTSMLYGLLYGSLLIFPQVWNGIRGLTPVQVGYTYFSVIFGFTLSAGLVGCTIQNIQYRRAFDLGKHSPELRLRSGEWSIICVPIGLFIFAWTAPFTHVHWSGPCIGFAIFSFGMSSVFNSWMAYLTDTYSNNTAAAIAINTFCRCCLAGAFPLFTNQMLAAMTVEGAMSMFAGVSIPLTVIGYLFGMYGERLRRHSKHAVYG